MEQEALILLENRDSLLPLSPSATKNIALIGPHAGVVSMGDYVFYNASLNGISPLDGVKAYLSSAKSSAQVTYAEGCKLWSNDESGFADAVAKAQAADVAVVMVGTWALDQTLNWQPNTNATTGEGRDSSVLELVGAQRKLVEAVVAAGKPTIVVFVSGRPIAEPWIQESESQLLCFSV
jgi:beta-glucosidase